MRLITIFLVSLACSVVMSCGDDIQYVDSQNRGATASGNAGGQPNSQQNINTHGETDGSSDPFADEAADRAAAARGTGAPAGVGKVLYSGTVKLADGYALPSSYTVYVIAYQPGTRIPALVQQYQTPRFPFPFTLTLANAQLGEPEAGLSLQLGVIVSQSGSVTPGGGVFSKTLDASNTAPGKTNIVLTAKP